jgi:hypothetical protein
MLIHDKNDPIVIYNRPWRKQTDVALYCCYALTSILSVANSHPPSGASNSDRFALQMRNSGLPAGQINLTSVYALIDVEQCAP